MLERNWPNLPVYIAKPQLFGFNFERHLAEVPILNRVMKSCHVSRDYLFVG